jgi:peptidoglycan/LPS O-acetylase OafA/YrhL
LPLHYLLLHYLFIAPLLGTNSVQKTAGVNPLQVFRQTENFGALNGVRALCCLAVIKEHAHWELSWPKSLNFGYLGVDMFFTISGFLIVTLMIREREARGTINVPAFYARRTLRIFPVYYGSVLAVLSFYLAISAWHPNGWQYYSAATLVLLTYTQDIIPTNIGYFFHTWSLAMEEQFYLFWPAVERFLTRTARWLVLAAIVGISQASNFGLFDPLIAKAYGTLKLPMYQVTFTPIALGVALAYLLHQPRSFAVLYRILGGRWAFLPALMAVFLLLEFCPEDLAGWPRLGIHLIFVVLLATLVIRPDHRAMKVLAFPPLVRIGTISYGMYLYHVFVLELTRMVVTRLDAGRIQPVLLFLIAAAITIAVSEISFRYFEAPLLRLGAGSRNRPRPSTERGGTPLLSRPTLR